MGPDDPEPSKISSFTAEVIQNQLEAKRKGKKSSNFSLKRMHSQFQWLGNEAEYPTISQMYSCLTAKKFVMLGESHMRYNFDMIHYLYFNDDEKQSWLSEMKQKHDKAETAFATFDTILLASNIARQLVAYYNQYLAEEVYVRGTKMDNLDSLNSAFNLSFSRLGTSCLTIEIELKVKLCPLNWCLLMQEVCGQLS
jgi:hypothetical protein